MIIFKSINKLNKELYGIKNIGFVPTMGSLHKGHISLIKKAKNNCNKIVVSIFINPTQFDKKDDYKRYPRNLNKDIILLKKYKVDYLIIPNFKELYNKKKDEKIKIEKSNLILCAAHRKGHFEGVLAVINQFLKKTKFNKIFLGEKDFQQLFLIKKFVKTRFKINVIPCKTIREKSFFPYSSRNKLLSNEAKIRARKISALLKNFWTKIKKDKKKLNEFHDIDLLISKIADKVEYFEIRNKYNLKTKFDNKSFKIFIAYYLNKIRIIDNY